MVTATPTVTAMRTSTIMDDQRDLLRLLTWLSPSFPVGAFSYSHGLEWAVEAEEVRDRASLLAWVEDIVTSGAGRNDLVLMAEAWHAAMARGRTRLSAVAELAVALSPSFERALETEAQGEAFRQAVGTAWPEATCDLQGVPYPIAVGVAAAGCRVALMPALTAYLHALAANLVSAGLRLIPLGQSDGVRIVAALEAPILAQADWAANSSLDDLGGFSMIADIASMRHETQYTRLFRS